MQPMKVYVLCVLFVACAATARAFDVDPYWKECSVNRTRPGSRTALHSAVQMVCKRRRAMISAGKSHTCVLSPKGFYKCFGDDEFGQSNKHREKWPISNGAKYVRSDTIDFTEFIMSVWNYCTFDMPSLIHFAFNFYDVGNSGMLTMDEAKGLIKEVYGEDAFEKNKELQQEISEVDMDKDGNISFEEFKDWVVRSPVILYPAFHMQQNIRKKVLGKKFWQKKRDQRIVWGNRSGKVLTLYDLLGDDEEVITQITDSKVAFANQMKNWSEKNPNSNITNKRDKAGRRKKRTTVALVPDKMKANFQAPGQNNALEPIGEDDGVPSRERNFTEELQQIDEEMEQVGEALSKDKELKKIEEEMDL